MNARRLFLPTTFWRLMLRAGSVLLVCIPAAVLPAQSESEMENTPDWAGRLVTLDQIVSQTTLQSIDADRQITLQGASGVVLLPAERLVCWGGRAATVRGSLLLLGESDLLAGDILKIDADHVTLFSDVWGEIRLPKRLIRAIVPTPSGQPGRRQRWLDRLRTEQARGDCLFPANGDRLEGHLLRADDLGVVFQTDRRRELTLDWRRVTGLLLTSKETESAPPTGLRYLVGFRDGGLLTATELTLENNRLRLVLADGTVLQSPAEADAGYQLTMLRPLGGRTVYLSDLPLLDYKHVPFLSLPASPRLDRGFTGGPLLHEDRIFTKGLGLTSSARLVFRLDRQYERFQVNAAIDQSAGQAGSVGLRVLTLQKGQSQPTELYRGPTIRGGAPSVAVSLDVGQADGLILLVDFADRGDVLDWLDLLDARLVQKPADE